VARIPLTVVVVLAVAWGLAATADPGGQAVRWFHSPSGNIQCEVAAADVRGTYAFCQTFSPPQIATLRRTGRTVVCARRACPIGNGPDNSVLLGYGRSIRVGPFRCTSLQTGMRCVVVADRRGFEIAREGVTTFRGAGRGSL
jgi:hypothetical protein